MDQRLILLTQLIKLGVAAAIASALVRSRDFKRLLFLQDANLRQRISLIIFIAIPYLLGVWVRQSVKNFLAADEAFEAILLMGVLGGPTAGAVGAVLVSLPALVHGEYATLPFNLAVGLIAGVLRDAAKRSGPSRHSLTSGFTAGSARCCVIRRLIGKLRSSG